MRLFSGALAMVVVSCLWVGLNAGLSRAQRPVPLMNGAMLPPLQSYPLPPSLSQWQAPLETGDYFEQVAPTEFGYLLWSRLPVGIYLEPAPQDTSAAAGRSQAWVRAVREAIAQWQVYLPLVEVETKEAANIVVLRERPVQPLERNPETGLFELPRVRTAETRYEVYWLGEPPQLIHRMTIQIRPGQSDAAALATARHEIGHALGIWGHSPWEGDALFFSQVRESPPISPRDINTLKKIYQQPTRLGGSVEKAANPQDDNQTHPNARI